MCTPSGRTRVIARIISAPSQIQVQSRLFALSYPHPSKPRISFRSRSRPNRAPCRHISACCRLSQAEASTISQNPAHTPTSRPAKSFDAANASAPNAASLASGFSDQPLKITEDDPAHVDWSSSFHGLSVEPFAKEAAEILLAPLDPGDVEIKPDGIIYLPEIKYRRILNKAFGPGGWGLAPRGESIVTPRAVTREYALVAHGRLVSIARGEQDYFSPDGIPTAAEGCKSNAMMRCCKDLGVASELWDPRFIRKFKAEKCREVFVEHVVSKKRTKIWTRKGDAVAYPFKETKFGT